MGNKPSAIDRYNGSDPAPHLPTVAQQNNEKKQSKIRKKQKKQDYKTENKVSFDPSKFNQDFLLYLVYGFIRIVESQLIKSNSTYKLIPDDIITMIKSFADFIIIPCKFRENDEETSCTFAFKYKGAKVRTAIGSGSVCLDGYTQKEEETFWNISFTNCYTKDITISILDKNNRYIMGKHITAQQHKIRNLGNDFTINVTLDRRDEFKRKFFRDDPDELNVSGKRNKLRIAAWDRLTVKFQDIDYELESLRRQEISGDLLCLKITTVGHCEIQALKRKTICSIKEWKTFYA